MPELIAITYPDQETASEVVRTLGRLQTEHVLEVDDVVAVIKEEDGKVRLDQRVDLTSLGAIGGALWGSLIGILFFAPLMGLLLGTVAGAIVGRFSDYGIDDDFMKEVGASLQRGGSAVFVLVRKSTPDKVLDAVGKYGGTVLRTSLSKDAESTLQTALDQHVGARS